MEIHEPIVSLISMTPHAEKVIENAGRTCYAGDNDEKIHNGYAIIKYESGTDLEHRFPLNRIGQYNNETFYDLENGKSIEIIRKEEASYIPLIKKLIKSGHTSVLEHATANFKFENVSRVLSHQLVRHRIASYSQRSQRYVKEHDFDFIVPPSIENNIHAKEYFLDAIKEINDIYNTLTELGIPKEDARYILPNACTTTINCSFNFRSIFNLCNERGHKRAQWEIRSAVIKMLELLKEKTTVVFDHYTIDYENNIIINNINLL